MIDSKNLLARINKIDRDEFEKDGSGDMLDEWIQQINEIEGLQAISETFVIKEMLMRYQNDVDTMNQILLSKPSGEGPGKLSDLERNNILDKKLLYTEFIQSFNAEAKLAGIERQIEKAEEIEKYDQ